tara:strand:+ start:44 stop:1402 length:1359 start_codon:yes stop_codon:yes gene_type:complete
MRVALIASPLQNWWHPSPSIVFLKGVLNRHGIVSTCFDANHEFIKKFGIESVEWTEHNRSYKDEYGIWIEEYVKQFLDYEWIGISIFTFNSQIFTTKLLKCLKNKTTAKIVLGGAGITSNHGDKKIIFENYGQKMIDEGLAHYVIHGEGDDALPALIKEESYILPQKSDLKDMPIPDYSDIDFTSYDNPIIVITGSRGCIRNCTFCDVHASSPRYTYRPGKEVANEVINQYYNYGVKKFHFSDALVNGNMIEFREFCKQLAAANLPIEWRGMFIFRSGMTEEDWDLIKKSGCAQLWVGIESGSQRVRWHMKKKFDNKVLYDSINACAERQIGMLYLMIVGYPTETEWDFQESLNVLKASRDFAHRVEVRVNLCMLLPDTQIRDDTSLWHGEIDLWKNYTEDGNILDYAERFRRWKIMSDLVEELGMIPDQRRKQLEETIKKMLKRENIEEKF